MNAPQGHNAHKIHNGTWKIMWKLNTMQQSCCWWMQQ